MSDRLDAAIAELVAAIREEIRQATEVAARAPDRLLSPAEAADVLGIARSTLYREIQAGRLRSIKVGSRRLIATSHLAEYIAAASGPRGTEWSRTPDAGGLGEGTFRVWRPACHAQAGTLGDGPGRSGKARARLRT